MLLLSLSIVSCDKDNPTSNDDNYWVNNNYNNNDDDDGDDSNQGYIYASSVNINQSSVQLDEGDSRYLSATVYPYNASNKALSWSSSNSSIVSVSSTGYIYANRSGTATITVKTTNNKSDSIRVTVVSSQSEVTINTYNARNYFSINVEDDGSIGSFYHFDVSVSRYGGVDIKSYTTFTIKVELEISYKAANSYITTTKRYYDNVYLSFSAGTYISTQSGRASIYIPSYAVPDGATNIEMYFSYKLSYASGKIAY